MKMERIVTTRCVIHPSIPRCLYLVPGLFTSSVARVASSAMELCMTSVDESASESAVGGGVSTSRAGVDLLGKYGGVQR